MRVGPASPAYRPCKNSTNTPSRPGANHWSTGEAHNLAGRGYAPPLYDNRIVEFPLAWIDNPRRSMEMVVVGDLSREPHKKKISIPVSPRLDLGVSRVLAHSQNNP